jgi:hypothetical protein
MGTLGTVTHRARWRRLKPTHALRLVPLLFGPELALPAGLSGQEECPDPVPVEVGPPGGVFQWSATPGLEGLARALGTYGAAFAPFRHEPTRLGRGSGERGSGICGDPSPRVA